MFSRLIEMVMSNLLYFALHLDNTSVFPKPLSAKDELECFMKMKLGDREARSRLIEHNLRLVAHIIKKYYPNAQEQEELISIGSVGLIKAVETFDCTKGNRFAAYGSRCIENEVLMHFRSQKKSAGEIHFETPIDTDKDGNQLTLIDIIEDSENVADHIEILIRSEQLYCYIEEILDEREREIICLRYGLNNKPPLTQREVAKKLNISRSYVSRLESKVLNKLRERFGDA